MSLLLCLIILILLLSWVFGRFQLVALAIQAVNETGEPHWRSWVLSAIEPMVTNVLVVIVGFFAFLYVIEAFEPIINGNAYILARTTLTSALSCSLFSLFIYLTDRKSKPSRLAIGAIFLRMCIILVAYGYSMISGNDYIILGCLVMAVLLRTLFGVYQWRVLKAVINPKLSKLDRLISDGDDDLWDEQVALIERLKAEEVIADQLVAEKESMVGRAQELV